MAELYSFFDSMPDENGQKDREYNAQEFTDYFGDLVTTGIMRGKVGELKVAANGSNMITEIDTGVAFVEGKRYANTAKLAHTLDTETLGKDRIDRIVIRKDLNTDARHVKSFIKKGVAAASPVPPSLTRNEMVYEISLAQVKVIGGQTFISAANVTDERGNEVVCPWAGSNILPSFDDNLLAEHVRNMKVHIKEHQESWIPTLLEGDWSNMAGQLSYYKDQFNVVHVRGVLKSARSISDSVAVRIFTLPVDYRPKINHYLIAAETNPLIIRLLTINTSGVVSTGGATANVPLSINVSFRVDE